jgi:hypothetical protein
MVVALVATGAVTVAVGNATVASAATCSGTDAVVITSLSFSPARVAAGQTSTATMVAQNCTAQPVSAISIWSARYVGSGTGIPAGCLAIDPVAFAANFAANGQVTRSLGYSTFAGCTATALQVSVNISSSGTLLASGSATLQIGDASTSSSPTATPAPCAVTYTRQSEWPGGFVASVTITNTGTAAVNGWTLAFSFPGDQRITNAWNATVTQTGAAVTAVNASYNKMIAAGASTSFGFQGTWRTSDASPASFTLNGVPCTTRAA